MTMLPFTLLALSLALALPGLFLMRRSQSLQLAGATILLLMATATGYIGVRLLLSTPVPTPPAAATPQAGSGQFHTLAAEQLPDALTASRGKMIMIDMHADWCPACIRWEKEVFSQPDIQQALKPLVLLKVDATDMTPATQALLDRYGLQGLPAVLVLGRDGREIPELRLLGEMSAASFRDWLATQLSPRL